MTKLGYMQQFHKKGDAPLEAATFIAESNAKNLQKSIKESLRDDFNSLVKVGKPGDKAGIIPMGCVPPDLILRFTKVNAKIIDVNKQPVTDRVPLYYFKYAHYGCRSGIENSIL